ncbi:hypothetical protein L226DRAFT_328319 [Lentinus tigrinus ALCF2SS1-7]|uniref:uncharacterized protein n=1 Tax=Lentinus tigrinus ALCF2SS1-7 TaxID=1328758 RepID=UPI001165D299|nr:hypothetical protein L226DRAFT_328319 [Lentinus tigrinus ALCF2SS1-7]
MPRSPIPTILLTPWNSSSQFLTPLLLTSDSSSLAVRMRVRLNSRTLYVTPRRCRRWLDLANSVDSFVYFTRATTSHVRHQIDFLHQFRGCSRPYDTNGIYGTPPVRMPADDTLHSLHRCADCGADWQLCTVPLARDWNGTRGRQRFRGLEDDSNVLARASRRCPSVPLLLSPGGFWKGGSQLRSSRRAPQAGNKGHRIASTKDRPSPSNKVVFKSPQGSADVSGTV